MRIVRRIAFPRGVKAAATQIRSTGTSIAKPSKVAFVISPFVVITMNGPPWRNAMEWSTNTMRAMPQSIRARKPSLYLSRRGLSRQ